MTGVFCIPDGLEQCGNANQGHHCNHPAGHGQPHACEHTSWPRDVNYELACLLYMAHWSTHYRDEPEYPPRRAVEAACRPADSPWRRLARIAETHLPKERE